MSSPPYPIPAGVLVTPPSSLDLRPDIDIDTTIQNPPPVTSEKNLWFFWHTGYASMQPYNKRNIRGWHRRLSKQNWTVRVLDCEPDSASNVAQFLDLNDRDLLPKAFQEGTIGGPFPVQNISDLVRFPLLVQYGGVYADVGMIQTGDLDRMWEEHIADPESLFDVVGYGAEDPSRLSLANYFFMARAKNPFFSCCNRLFLKLWEGKTSTEGMSSDALLDGIPLLQSAVQFEMNGKMLNLEEVSSTISDFVVQTQVISMVMGIVDDEEGWNGPEYVAKHLYRINAATGSLLYKFMTGWDGQKAFKLFSLHLPRDGEEETAEQAEARGIVEACLGKSFSMKFYHSMISKMIGETLGTLWRKNEGSDDVPGTYAHWLRYGAVHWSQDGLPERLEFEIEKPLKTGPLLRST